jgi:hypothetical protein
LRPKEGAKIDGGYVKNKLRVKIHGSTRQELKKIGKKYIKRYVLILNI